MSKIDQYAQQLARYGANAIELVSGRPVRFKLPDGDRDTAKAVEHQQIVGLIQEAAPPNVIETLRATRRASFRRTADEIGEYQIDIDATSEAWMLRITKAVAKPAPAPAAPALGAVASRRAATADVGISLGDPPPASPAPVPVAAPPPAAPPPEEKPIGSGHKPAGAGIRIEMQPGEPKLNHYLRLMKAVDASDLHMSSGVVPMVRRHGEMVPLEDRAPLTDDEMMMLVDEIIPERSRKEYAETHDADFAHQIKGLARFRANVFRDRKGTGAVFRQIPYQIVSAEKLGVPKRVLDLCWLTKGLVLVTGPTGSGKSTTLASLIDYINDNRSDHIITIEDPVEFVHENKKCLVNQREIGTHTKGFKNALRAALREDPDIVLVGEMRDLETISIAIETAETGHLVFGTLHTTSAPSTVDRIIDQFPPEQQGQIRVMLSESLRGVISQVLCKKAGGGRVAAYEILIANSAVANLIREGKTFQLRSVMQTGRNLGMQTMNEHLLEHVRNKLVDPQEAYMKSNDKILMKEALSKLGHKLEVTE